MIIMIITLIWFLKKKHHTNPSYLFFWYGGAKNGSFSCLLKLFYPLIKAS